MNNRVYNDKVNVDDKNIKAFFNNRAKRFAAGEVDQYTSVVLGDNKPDYGKEWHEFEKKQVVQHLNLGPDKKVLDIGCGIGRWAENIIDHCGEYIGTDFSDEMIRSAGERFKSYSNALFINSSFQDIFKNKKIIGRKFDTVIIAGVSMYINDADLRKGYDSLADVLNEGAIVYIEESIGVNERLTLDHIWSDSLKDNYDAIYRTRKEYLELMSGLTNRVQILKEGYFEQLDKKELSETSHWYIFLKKC